MGIYPLHGKNQGQRLGLWMIEETLMENNPWSSLPDDNAQAVVVKRRSIQQQQDGKDAAKSEKDGGT